MNTPSWWKSPQLQLKRASELWPSVELPEPPLFRPQSADEVLLLHVPRHFESLWNIIIDSNDNIFTPNAWNQWPYESNKWRRTTHERYASQPVWIIFDPSARSLEEVSLASGEVSIAGSEVLSAMIQFPDLYRIWADNDTYPCISGYELRNQARVIDEWIPTLYQVYFEIERGLLSVVHHPKEKKDNYSLFPTVRKC